MYTRHRACTSPHQKRKRHVGVLGSGENAKHEHDSSCLPSSSDSDQTSSYHRLVIRQASSIEQSLCPASSLLRRSASCISIRPGDSSGDHYYTRMFFSTRMYYLDPLQPQLRQRHREPDRHERRNMIFEGSELNKRAKKLEIRSKVCMRPNNIITTQVGHARECIVCANTPSKIETKASA